MKLSYGAAALLALASGTSAQNVVQFDLNRGLPGVRLGSAHPKLSRRATLTSDLVNNITGGAYYVDVSVGTPGQTVSMVLDTGSSDAWVVGTRANLCIDRKLQEYYQQQCLATYNPARSSSYKMLYRNSFNIKYLDGGGAAGDFITDDFTIAGTTIKSLQMGYARQTSRGTGILGIGFNTSESAAVPYPNIIDQLRDQGKIGTKAYSVWLNDRRSQTGTILFGGIDKGKFIGPLKILPIIKADEAATPTAFDVAFYGMSVKYTNGSKSDIRTSLSNDKLAAVLDTGSTLSYLPEYMTSQIFTELGAVTESQVTGLTLIDCKYLTSEPDLVVSFDFGGTATITVPVWELVLDLLADYQYLMPADIPFDNVCVFGIQSTTGFEESQVVENATFALLGETFLRSAYAVYDLDSHQIGIAQANLNSTDVDIVELKAEDKGLPTLIGALAQQTTNPPRTTTPTDGGGGGGTQTVTVTATPDNAGRGGSARLPGGGGAGDLIAVMAITSIFALVGGALVAL
ncbi:acid protease [Apodospora peruviana]|uniref:Acid protease n=1 Tax=Apodospora peruviana TaxID=516989 RepID=A0AAE0IT79_9PEZI|nr:acid protease [Apodospora peruviana]